MRFCETRPERTYKETPPLVGDAQALGRLFSHPPFMPHGVSFALGKRKRTGRGGEVIRCAGMDPDGTQRYETERGPDGLAFVKWSRARGERHAHRFAVKGIGGTAKDRRLMRNARKQERSAA